MALVKAPQKATDSMIDATFKKGSKTASCDYERNHRAAIYEKMIKAASCETELYKTSIFNFMPLAQAGADLGLEIPLVSAGSRYVTVRLNAEEFEALTNQGIFLQKDIDELV